MRKDHTEYIETMMCESRKRTRLAIQAVQEWNELYPVGTNIWATDTDGEPWKTSTRTPAQVSYEQAMIYIKGNPVAQSLDSVRPLRRKKAL